MAVGHVVDVKWIHEDWVYPGSYCTAQGAGFYIYEGTSTLLIYFLPTQ